MVIAGGCCEACHQGIGLWQAAFTSECSHSFHLRCVSGTSVCPVCAARWRYKPVVAPATAPATAFSFFPHPQQETRTTTSLFGVGQPAAAATFGSHPTPVSSSCAVCHRVAGGPGDREGIVTSECSHMFHLGCLRGVGTTSVCLACKTRWRDSVAADTASASASSSFGFSSSLFGPSTSSFSGFGPSSPFGSSLLVYDDDEPVESPPPAHGTVQEIRGELILKTHCEHPAVARGTPHEKFVVLVHAKAPGAAAAAAAARAPLDLVTVLDVSGSMVGPKLALVQAAMGFVIDKLGPDDRLSIVSFSSDARRLMRLTRMSDSGKASAMGAVRSLSASGGTDILKGLSEAVKVLDGRRYRNAVTSVVLLSDGQDTAQLLPYSITGWFANSKNKSHELLVPGALLRSSGSQSTLVHTFGFGTDHDAAAMHTIAEATGGTFSFIENQAVVQDAFAQCIGGLISVAVQEAWISVTCPGVRVRAVKSGRYKSRVEAYGRAASVDVGELYADEERRFLLLVDVPIARDGEGVTRLVKVSCTYRDAATGRLMDVAGEDAVVQRPAEVTDVPQEPSMEVKLERFRVKATEDIAAARAATERGEHGEAARILDRRQDALPPGLDGGDARCAALVAELRELSARVGNRRDYEQTGRACLLSGMSSHAQQRASSVHVFGAQAAAPSFGAAAISFGAAASGSSPFGATALYATPAMQSMVESSKKAREQQQQPPATMRTFL